jgi:capsular polysaccharide biosynthesis protein
MRELRDYILDAYGLRPARAARRRVYVSRARAAKRKVANEDDVVAVLRGLDFEVVRSEELTFEQQVRLAAETKTMVSNHGAGLTNMLFMPAAGAVLELRRSGERERNCFFNLAAAVGIDYDYQNCAQQRLDDTPHVANVVVDTRELRETLERMPR